MRISWPWCTALLLNGVALGALVSEAATSNVERNPSLLRIACAVGAPSACTSLGWLIWDGTDLPQDLGGAEAFFAKACDAGDGRGCRALAGLSSGWQFVASPRSEAETRQKAFLDGKIDLARAGALLQRGCDAGDGQACWDLSRRLRIDASARSGQRRDDIAGLVKDPRALALVTRACQDLHYQFACSDLASVHRLDGNEQAAARAMASGAAWPLPLKLWLGSLVLSVVSGLLFVRSRKHRRPNPRNPDRWIRVTGMMAAAFVALSAVLFSTGQSQIAAASAWVGLLSGLSLGVSSGLVWARRDHAARVLLAATGFLLLPLGLFAILVSREIAESQAVETKPLEA